VLIVLTLSVKPLDQLLHASAQNRIDQQQWQSLISQLKEIAPRGGYVVLDFDEPYMIETAQSIEANTLLAGRYDLTYHLQFKNNDALAKDPFLASLIKTYLGGQTPVPEGADIFIVQADRKGTTLNVPVPSLPESLSRFLASPRQAFFERYIAGKTPYLNYQIEYQDSPPKKGEI